MLFKLDSPGFNANMTHLHKNDERMSFKSIKPNPLTFFLTQQSFYFVIIVVFCFLLAHK
jgi:hypothetical protein